MLAEMVGFFSVFVWVKTSWDASNQPRAVKAVVRKINNKLSYNVDQGEQYEQS